MAGEGFGAFTQFPMRMPDAAPVSRATTSRRTQCLHAERRRLHVKPGNTRLYDCMNALGSLTAQSLGLQTVSAKLAFKCG
jgi:hypothetical protein